MIPSLTAFIQRQIKQRSLLSYSLSSFFSHKESGRGGNTVRDKRWHTPTMKTTRAVADPGFPVGEAWTPEVATFRRICMSK